jgi:hypothetical protein
MFLISSGSKSREGSVDAVPVSLQHFGHFQAILDAHHAYFLINRFREAQAIEMGVARAKTDRRPRMASSVSSLKDCERWRGEIVREISRKVSKIQDGQ